MATRNMIMVVDRRHAEESELGFADSPEVYADNSRVNIYMHHDGYPEWQGVQIANWLNEKHVVEKVKQGYVLKLGSVDLESDRMDKYTHSNMQRKFIWYFVKDNYQSRNVDGMKPIGQAMPQYSSQQMTEAQPSAPDNAQPVTMEDHKSMRELDDDLPPF